MNNPPITLSRRGLFAAGAGAAAGLTAGGLIPPAHAATTLTPGLAALRAKAGGGLYYGSIISSDTTVEAFERRLGRPLGSRRNYHQPDEVDKLVQRAAEDVAAGRLSVLSIKPQGTWRQIALGKRNAWLNSILDGLAELDGPVCFTIHHEPENDTGGRGSGMTPYWHRRMTEFAVEKARRRAPNVEVIQVLMAWTFHPLSKRRPKRWLARNVSMFGIDAYNWWSPSNPSAVKWIEFGDMVDRVKPFAGDRPIIVAEYGTRTDPDRPGRAAQWMYNAMNYSLANNVLSLNYFNTAPPGIKEPFILDAERLEAFRECLHDPQSLTL